MPEEPKGEVDSNILFPPSVSKLLAKLYAKQDMQKALEEEERKKRPLETVIVPSNIQEFINTIPQVDRQTAITEARRRREESLVSLWKKEQSQLSSEMVKANQLNADAEGWKSYLQLAFEKEHELRKRYGFDDWSKKYLAQMLNTLTEDEYRTRQGMEDLIRVKGSFLDYYFSGASVNPEIWHAAPTNLDNNSLFVHSISEGSLKKAISSGVLGREGLAAVAFCQDRIVYDRGYIVVFQANELSSAGYPLICINEDPRDAKILNEWRSVVPVNISLARLITPTTVIPDRWNASRAHIATSYFGEQYLKELPRL